MSRAALAKETYTPEPFGVMRRLSDEMDRFFQGVGMPRAFSVWRDEAWTPAVEAFARNGAYVVRADLPGLTDKDVTVEVAGDLLTIKGERKQEKEVTRDGYYSSERSYGTFVRAMQLPDGAVGDAAAATFKNGVLEVTVPLAEVKPPLETRTVTVTPG